MNRKRIGIILVIMAVIVGGIVGYYHERPETNGSINASNDQKKKLEQQQDEKCKELVQQKGRYDEKTIVLSEHWIRTGSLLRIPTMVTTVIS